MSNDDNNSYNDIPTIDIITQRFNLSQFWIFLLLVILSIICSFFALYHFLLNRPLRQALHNQIIIFLLFINLFYEFTDNFWFIHFFRTLNAPSPSPIFRLIWGYIDWTFYLLQFLLFAWTTIERHILIFHELLLATKKKRFFIHYLPPILLTIYYLLYYTIIFFFDQCKNEFDNLTIPSFYPCAFQNNVLFMYETIIHDMLPTLTIIISSLILLLRVVWQKYRFHQQVHWRRHRKMIIQVLSISLLYLIFPFPSVIINLLHLCGVPSDVGAEFQSYSMYFTYHTLLIFPIACIGSSPDLRGKLKELLRFRRQTRAVAPNTFAMTQLNDNRQVIQ